MESSPTKWYHWVLLYPALATTIVGSIPTALQWIRAQQLDASYSNVQIIEEQRKLWETNIPCITARPVYTLDIDDGLSISVTLCNSGDILVLYQRGSSNTYTWIEYPDTTTPLVTSPEVNMRILLSSTRCIRLKGGYVLKLSQERENKCIIEHILLRTSSIVARTTVDCATRCERL